MSSINRTSTQSTTAEPHESGDPPAVQLGGVTHEYTTGGRLRSTGREPVRALADVSLSIASGEVVGIRGPSGSGKSTVLHAIAGLLVPTDGSVELFGTDLTDCAGRKRLRLRRQHVGIVFQHFHLLPSLSARANVALPLVQLGQSKATRRRRASALLERVGLGDRLAHRPGELSGGERQRVAIARSLSTDPDVVVADEPTGELDTATSESVLDVLTSVADDRAVVLASHDPTTLAWTDRTITLCDGSIVEETNQDEPRQARPTISGTGGDDP